MDDLKVAAVCMKAVPGKVERNLDRIQAFVLEAAREHADIICFPELCVTGYTLTNPQGIYPEGEFIAAMDRLIRMAVDARIVLIAGLIENLKGNGPFISQVIAGPGGLIGLYRKTHLSPHEEDIYLPGQRILIYRYGNTQFGIQLCYDAHFPEISTVMALMGAEILFMPHASPRGDAHEKLNSWLRHLTARAFDNGVFVVACNQVGRTEAGFSFPGVALVLGPDGQVLAKQTTERESILYAVLKARALQDVREHRMRYFISRRRPELYGMILR